MPALLSMCLAMILLALPLLAGADTHREPHMVTYKTVTVPFADVGGTSITGRLRSGPVGLYLDANQQLHSFVHATHGPVQGLPFLNVQDASIAGLVGSFHAPGVGDDQDTGIRGFLLTEGTAHVLQVPRVGRGARTVLTEAVAVNDAGVVVGSFQREGEDGAHGWHYNHATRAYTVIDTPGATGTLLLGISPAGLVLVRAVVGGVVQHLIWDHGVFTTVPAIPDLPGVELVGRTDTGVLAGNVGQVGVVWDGQRLTEIDVPDAVSTDVNGIDAGGRVVWGSYRDPAGVDHGFVATLGAGGTRQRGSQQRSEKMHAAFTVEDCGPGSKRQVCVEARRSQD